MSYKHHPRFNFQLCPRYTRILTVRLIFTQALCESFEPTLGQHWCRLCMPGIKPCTGNQAVLILSAIIWQERGTQTKLCSPTIRQVAQLPVVTGKSKDQSDVSSAWPLIWESSSASRQLPRMHLSSCHSAVATLSCSLTDCSHCWMLEI